MFFTLVILVWIDTFFIFLELLIFIVQDLLLRIFSVSLRRFIMMLFVRILLLLPLTSYLWVWAFLSCCSCNLIINFLMSDFLSLMSIWNWWAHFVLNLSRFDISRWIVFANISTWNMLIIFINNRFRNILLSWLRRPINIFLDLFVWRHRLLIIHFLKFFQN